MCTKLCSSKFYSLIKTTKNFEFVFNILNQRNNRKVRGTLCQNGRGYIPCLLKTKISHIYPFYKLIDTILSAFLLPSKYIANKQYEKTNYYSKKRGYQDLGLILSGFGIVIALCEAPSFTKEKRFLRAAQFGNIPELKKVLTEGMDVNTRHSLGWTALQTAAINGKVDALKFLLEKGADPNLGDGFVNVYRTAMEKGIHSLDVLMKREEEFSDRLNSRASFQGFTALHYAVLADSMACVKVLLDAGANPTIENEAGHRAVEYARDSDMKEILIKHALKYDEILKEKVRNNY